MTQSYVHRVVVWQFLPAGPRARFDLREVRHVARFTAGVAGIGGLAFLLTQSDRLLLSKVLTLDRFGQYVLAATVATAIGRITYPLYYPFFPRYSQLVSEGDAAGVASFYHRTNQLAAVAVVPAAVILAIFAYDILRIWTHDPQLAHEVAPLLSLLSLGWGINSTVHLPYAPQLAYGWTRLGFFQLLVSVIVYIPALWILTREMGAAAAAGIWLTLNLSYLLIGIPLMHRRLLTSEMRAWVPA